MILTQSSQSLSLQCPANQDISLKVISDSFETVTKVTQKAEVLRILQQDVVLSLHLDLRRMSKRKEETSIRVPEAATVKNLRLRSVLKAQFPSLSLWNIKLLA